MSEIEPSEEPGSVDVEHVYLTVDDVLDLYAELFECTTIEAADQIRSREGLEGALARPYAYAVYEGADLPLQAAALAHGIAESQYFVEGNKRIALITLMTFLRINGQDVVASQHERAMWILDLSAGLTVSELARKIREHLVVREE
jgi:death on curing protein